jgi:cellulose synthase/poly-beta-1,6-N-acetylglucosamine synthase-like glycosyltransferase
MFSTFGEIATLIILFSVAYFEVFMFMTYIEEYKQIFHGERKRMKDEDLPTVTIIVPAWNEGTTTVGTINSILDLDYPPDKLDVFFVDDGSTDDTLAVAKEYFGNNPRVKINTKPNGGKHTAMNMGIKESTSDIIGCLDADSYVEPIALREMIPFFENKEVAAVTPTVQIYNPDNWLRHIQAIEYMIGTVTRKILSRLNALYVTPGPFSLFRREIFAKIGDFRNAYNTEDMEMALRIQSHKMKIENAHTAVIWTIAPKTIKTLYKQRVRWVTGFLKNAWYSYRHLILKTDYGYFGVLALPFACVSIFTSLFFTASYVKTIIKAIYDEIIYRQAVGFNLGWPSLKFDPYDYDLTFHKLVIYILLLSTLTYITFGVRLIRKKYTIARGTISFLLLYGLIAPFWLAKSVYNLITSKEAKWR